MNEEEDINWSIEVEKLLNTEDMLEEDWCDIWDQFYSKEGEIEIQVEEHRTIVTAGCASNP